jgi:hypothetical protein
MMGFTSLQAWQASSVQWVLQAKSVLQAQGSSLH